MAKISWNLSKFALARSNVKTLKKAFAWCIAFIYTLYKYSEINNQLRTSQHLDFILEQWFIYRREWEATSESSFH